MATRRLFVAGLLYSLVAKASAQLSLASSGSCYLTSTVIYDDVWFTYMISSSSRTFSPSTLTTSSQTQGSSTSSTMAYIGSTSTTSSSEAVVSLSGQTSIIDISSQSISSLSLPASTTDNLISSTTTTPSDIPAPSSSATTTYTGTPAPTSSPFVIVLNVFDSKLRKRARYFMAFVEGVAHLTDSQTQAAVFTLTDTTYLMSGDFYVEPDYSQVTSEDSGRPTFYGSVALRQTSELNPNRYSWFFDGSTLKLGEAEILIGSSNEILVNFGGAPLPPGAQQAQAGTVFVQVDSSSGTSSIIFPPDSTTSTDTDEFTTRPTFASDQMSLTTSTTQGPSLATSVNVNTSTSPATASTRAESTSTSTVAQSSLTTAASPVSTSMTPTTTPNVGSSSTRTPLPSTSSSRSRSDAFTATTSSISSGPFSRTPSSTLSALPLSVSPSSTSSSRLPISSSGAQGATTSRPTEQTSINSPGNPTPSTSRDTSSQLALSSAPTASFTVSPLSTVASTLHPSSSSTSSRVTVISSASLTMPSVSALASISISTSSTSSRSASSSPSSTTTTTSSTSIPYPSRRGLAYSNITTLSCYPPPTPYISWTYNYYSLPNASDNIGPYPSLSPTGGPQFRFLPLLYNDAPSLTSIWSTNVDFSITHYNTDAIFGFNEPDACFSGKSACMSLQASVQGYRDFMQPFAGRVAIGSVSVTNNGQSGLEYLSQFLGNATLQNLTVDFINLHWYASPYNIEYFKEYVTEAYAVTGGGRYPVWITEFGMDRSDYDTVMVQQFLKNATKWLDAQSWVGRYAWFGNFPSGTGTEFLLNGDGSGLGPLGKIWNGYNGTG